MKLAIFTGMRRGEIFKLKWDHIDFDNKIIYVKDAKSGRDEQVPMNSAAEKVLKDYLGKYGRADEYVFFGTKGRRRNVDKPCRAIRDAAGLPKSFRPLHGLRHFYLSEAAESGASQYEIMELGRHSDPRMSKRYIHTREERLKLRSEEIAKKIQEKFGR
jgi:integrase